MNVVDPLVRESFSRLFCIYRIAERTPSAFVRSLLSRKLDRGDKDPLPVWTSLDAGRGANMMRFLLPSVRSYLALTEYQNAGRDRFLHPLALNPLIRNELRRLQVGRFRCSLKEFDLFVFSTGIAVGVLHLELERVVAKDPPVRPLGTDPEQYVIETPPSEADWQPPTLEDLIEFNYTLRNNDPGQAPTFRLVVPAPREGLPPQALAAANRPRWWHSILPDQTGAPVSRILHNLGLQPCCVLPQDEGALRIQTFARVPGTTGIKELRQPFYNLRRLVKDSYRPAPSDLRIGDNPEVIRSYGNILIGMSLEGMAMLVIDSDHPFMQQISERARTSYSTHYLLGLHQRAACLSLLREAAEIPPLRDATVTDAQVRQVTTLRRRVINFTLHHRLSQVSTQTVYARSYERLLGILQVPTLLDEVRDEVQELDEVLRMAREEDRVERERRLSHFAAVFAVLAVLVGTFGMNMAPFADSATQTLGLSFYRTGSFLLPASVSLLLLMFIFRSFVRRN